MIACLAHKTKSLWTLNCASADVNVNVYGVEYLISLGPGKLDIY